MTERSILRALPITGYLDRLSARPGGRLEVKVSAQSAGDYAAEVVRIVCGDPNPAGPGLDYRAVDFGLAGRYPARAQAVDRGSYALVPPAALFAADSLSLGLLAQPWLLREEPSVLAAALDPEGRGWRLEATATALRFLYCATTARSSPSTCRWPCAGAAGIASGPATSAQPGGSGSAARRWRAARMAALPCRRRRCGRSLRCCR